jgi:hypothetical protein
MPESFSYLIPLPPAAPSQQFEAYSFTHAFYDEVQVRQAHAEYCRWYAQVAAQNRREAVRMRSEWNPLGWFYGS